jgi:hypothetical protein
LRIACIAPPGGIGAHFKKSANFRLLISHDLGASPLPWFLRNLTDRAALYGAPRKSAFHDSKPLTLSLGARLHKIFSFIMNLAGNTRDTDNVIHRR